MCNPAWRHYPLYGGTALALRLGHRRSDDFDFFSSARLDSARLLREVPYLRGAEVLQRSPDTLTCLVDRGGSVRVSFFGGLTLCRVADPETLAAPAIAIASPLDLAATKAEVVQARAAAKDYLDLDALVRRAGVSLADALGAAAAVFGPAFNPLLTVKALCFFADGDLATLPRDVCRRLLDAAIRGRPRAPAALRTVGRSSPGLVMLNPGARVELLRVAKRMVWFKSPEEALADATLS